MDDVEHTIVEAAGAVERLHGELADQVDRVGSADGQLARELESVLDSMRADASQLKGIASRWHNLDR
jgi:hypothetical protein